LKLRPGKISKNTFLYFIILFIITKIDRENNRPGFIYSGVSFLTNTVQQPQTEPKIPTREELQIKTLKNIIDSSAVNVERKIQKIKEAECIQLKFLAYYD
jgi:hypothetical protein